MANETDITLTVGLDTKDADKTAKQLQKEVENIFNSRNGQQSASLTQLQLQMKKNYNGVKELQDELQRLSNIRIKSEQFAELESRISSLVKESGNLSNAYEEAQRKAEDLTIVDINDDSYTLTELKNKYSSVSKELEDYEEHLIRLKNDYKALTETGEEYLQTADGQKIYLEDITAEMNNVSANVARLKTEEQDLSAIIASASKDIPNMKFDFDGDGNVRSLNDMKESISQISNELEEVRRQRAELIADDSVDLIDPDDVEKLKALTEEENKLKTKLDSINDKLKQQIIHHREIEGKLKGSSKEMNKLANATNKTRKASGKMSSSFSKGLGTVMKTAKRAVVAIGALFLGVRGLMSIFNKLRSAILEGFKNLEQSNVSKLKQQMEDLRNASTTMKNALAGAFEPIVTMIIPYIQRLVEWLTIAIDKMAQFIAAVSGQKTYIRAIKQVGNAAEKAGNQAKKALGPLDNLNVLTTSEGGGAGEMFEEATIPDSIFDKIEKLKEIFKAIADEFDRLVATPFKEGFFSVLPDAEQRLGRIKDNIMSISDTIMEIANNPEVQQASEGFVQAFWKNQGAWIGLGAKIGLIVGENITGGVDQFLSQHKNEIQTDIVKNLGITEERLDTATKLAEAIGKIIEPLSEQDAIDTTSATIGIMYENISGIGTVVNELTTDLSELAANPIIENADSLNESLSILLKILSPLAQGIETVAGAFKRTFISIYEEGVGPVIDEVTRVLTEFVGMVSEWWNNGLGPFLQGIAEDLKGIFEKYVSPIIEDLGGVIVELLVPIKDMIADLWDNVIKPFLEWFINEEWPKLQPMLQGLWDIIKGLVEYVLAVIDTVLFTIKKFLAILNDLYHGDFTKLFTDIQDFIKGWNERQEKQLKGLLDIVKGILELIQAKAINFVKNIEDRVNRFVKNIENAWDNIKTQMDRFASILGDGFKTAWNNVKTTIDNIISGIKDSVGNFVDWCEGVIENITSGFSSVSNFFSGGSSNTKILYGAPTSGAASGAVIPPSMSEHLIKVGDNNVETEIISPLSTMKEAMVEALSQAGIGGNGTQQIVLQLDGKTFMTAMVNQNNEYKKMHGGKSAYA